MATPARFVVICDEARVRLWEERCLREVIASGVGAVAGIVYTGRSQSTAGGDATQRKSSLQPFFHILERFSQALEYTEFDTSSDVVPVLDRAAAGGERFETEAAAFVTALAPDFVLILGAADRGVALRLSGLTRWGGWSYRFGAALSPLPHEAALEASRSGSPTITAALVATSKGERILHEGSVGTFLAKPGKTLDQLCFSIVPWLRRACFDVARNGMAESRFPEARHVAAPTPRSTITSALALLWGMARGFVAAQIHYRLSRQQWNVGVASAPISVVAGLEGPAAQAKALNSVQWMPEERGKFFADPFGYETDSGNIRILFELFDWRKGRGSIALRDFDGSAFDDVRTILDPPTHLSYPFVTSLDGERHYIPEHAEARDVAAYALDAGGQSLRKQALFAGVEFLDCTFVEWAGKLWMFSTQDRHAKNTELFVHFADDFDGPWREHPLNPVKTDVGSARPGGTPFVHAGKLFRPSQDCSTHYGRATVINEITVLSETEFAERPVSRVEPPPGSRYSFGLHTVSQVGNVTLVDGARKTGRWFA